MVVGCAGNDGATPCGYPGHTFSCCSRELETKAGERISMLVNTIELVQEARRRGVAIGAFNTYNLELTQAIVVAAEKYGQPIILQLGVQAIRASGEPRAVATLAAARVARVPLAVHLDHWPDLGLIEACFAWGFSSTLADGLHLPFAEHIGFTKRAVELAARYA